MLSGFSDHTLGIEAPVVATTLGAKIIEKHFILDRKMGGVDSHFSLDFEEFKNMVIAVRNAELLIGEVDFSLNDKKLKSREHCRSLYVTSKIRKGEIFSSDNIRSVRPGNGLHPKHYDFVIGKFAANDINAGEPLSFYDIQN